MNVEFSLPPAHLQMPHREPHRGPSALRCPSPALGTDPTRARAPGLHARNSLGSRLRGGLCCRRRAIFRCTARTNALSSDPAEAGAKSPQCRRRGAGLGEQGAQVLHPKAGNGAGEWGCTLSAGLELAFL